MELAGGVIRYGFGTVRYGNGYEMGYESGCSRLGLQRCRQADGVRCDSSQQLGISAAGGKMAEDMRVEVAIGRDRRAYFSIFIVNNPGSAPDVTEESLFVAVMTRE